MSFLTLSESSLRTVAQKLKISQGNSLSFDALSAEIVNVFSSQRFFGEVTRVESTNRAESTLIWCHGLTGTGDRWKSFVTDKLAPSLPSMRFVLPTAPTRRLIRDPSQETTAWYDFLTTDGSRSPDLDDLLVSAAYISYLARKEHQALSSDGITGKVFFGGFSQGATLALYTLLTSAFPFAGILAVGGYSPRFEKFDRNTFAATSSGSSTASVVPLFIGHGDADDIIPLTLHNRTVRFLLDSGVPESAMTAKVYSGLRHSTCEAEVKDMVSFCIKQLVSG
ncbi:carboxylesterase [Perkinsela sp. CCAP 1560/4]|nr:carboxylesterase [Perkinsela sp. CCAP 1560/4]|eukprot:KNH07365.1 carboxylesterase [Perkinsela sp. CCAP 1560/4]